MPEREQNLVKQEHAERPAEMKASSQFEAHFTTARMEDQKRRARRTFRLTR